MGKKKKNADFQKVKFKVGKKLPKSANFTDTTFKSRSIVIREQLKSAVGAPVSKNKHTLQELLSQARHYNATMRQSAASSLQELISSHPDVLRQNASTVLDAALALCSDRESSVRAAALRLVGTVLAGFDEAAAKPFFAAVGAHVCRALTHLSDSVRVDALQLFDSVAAAYPSFVATRAPQLLTIFVDQISKAGGSNGGSGAQRRTLTIDPSSLLSEQRNRNRVLKRIRLVLETLVDGGSRDDRDHSITNEEDIRRHLEGKMYYFCSRLSRGGTSTANRSQNGVAAVDVPAFAASLCPLLTEHWIESMPASSAAQRTAAGHFVKPTDVSALENVPSIATLIWRLLQDSLRAANGAQAFNGAFVDHGKALAQTLLAGFPYTSNDHQVGQQTKRKGMASETPGALEDQGTGKRPNRRPGYCAVDKATAGAEAAAAGVSEQLQPLPPPAIVLLPSLQEQLFRGCHHGLRGEHRGGLETLAELHGKYYWPGMDGDAGELLRTCQSCQTARPASPRPWLPPGDMATEQSTARARQSSGDGRLKLTETTTLYSTDGSNAKQAATMHFRASGTAGKLATSGAASVDGLNVAISCYIGTLVSCKHHCEPAWAKRVLSFIAAMLSGSRVPPARTVRQLLDAAYLLFQQTETEEADGTNTFTQVFCDLFFRSIDISSMECILAVLQFTRSTALTAATKLPPKIQQLASAVARPLVCLLKGASSWPMLLACGQPAATMLRDLTIRGLCQVTEEDLAACLDRLLAVDTGTTSQDDVAIYLRKLVDLVACSRVELTRTVLVPLSKLLRLLHHCNATLSYALHALCGRYLHEGLLNGVDFFSFLFTLLVDDPASAEHCRPAASSCVVDAELTNTWTRAQVVHGALLQFPDSEGLGSILNAFIGRVVARHEMGLPSSTCAALLLCAQGIDSTGSMPAGDLLHLVVPLVLQKPEGTKLSALLVDILSSRKDVLGSIVHGLQRLSEQFLTDGVTQSERVCGALTWLLRSIPAHVLASTGALSKVEEYLSAVDKLSHGSSTDVIHGGSSAPQSLWYELRHAKMEALARPAASES